MVEQGYNYTGCPIHSVVEFFETRIENLEQSIPPSIPSLNSKKNKKGSKKRKALTFDNSEDNKLGSKTKKERSFAITMACADIPWINAACSGH